jgi:hypothetical protein
VVHLVIPDVNRDDRVADIKFILVSHNAPWKIKTATNKTLLRTAVSSRCAHNEKERQHRRPD